LQRILILKMRITCDGASLRRVSRIEIDERPGAKIEELMVYEKHKALHRHRSSSSLQHGRLGNGGSAAGRHRAETTDADANSEAGADAGADPASDRDAGANTASAN
jgi:hypothetical protein